MVVLINVTLQSGRTAWVCDECIRGAHPGYGPWRHTTNPGLDRSCPNVGFNGHVCECNPDDSELFTFIEQTAPFRLGLRSTYELADTTFCDICSSDIAQCTEQEKAECIAFTKCDKITFSHAS